jgi:hypothetical protein
MSLDVMKPKIDRILLLIEKIALGFGHQGLTASLISHDPC